VLTRRSFLVTGLALGAGASSLLGACSSGDGDGNGEGDAAPFDLARRFTDDVLVPGEVRLPVSLVRNGEVQLSGPDSLRGRIVDNAGTDVATVEAGRRDIDPQAPPYWSFRAQIAQPGIYVLRVDGDNGDGAAFEVFATEAVVMPHLGSTLPSLETPTVDDHRGVEPYCSLTPEPCALHEVTLAEAFTFGTPVAFLVGTPAHCQTGTCAPGLEFLVNTHRRVGSAVAMVHADVFADNAGTQVAPTVTALGLSYEPVLYLCSPDGVVVDQLDGVWNQTEVDECIDRLIAQFS
jgi:hypothetical protein